MARNYKDISVQAFKTFRHVLDRMYNQKTKDVMVKLGGGYPVPDFFPLPKYFKNALTKYYTSPEGGCIRPGYDAEGGELTIRKEVTRQENKKFGTHYTEKNVAFVAGATYGTNRIFEMLFPDTKSGELLVVSPTFYKGLWRTAQRIPLRSIVIPAERFFVPSAEDILGTTRKQTRAVFLCNPGNPSGRYMPGGELRKLVNGLSRRNIFLIIDEVQDAFPFGKTAADYRSWIQNHFVVRIRSLSKVFTLAEYRIGYVIADPDIIGDNHNGLIKIVGYDMGNPPPALNMFINTVSSPPNSWLRILNGRRKKAKNMLQKTNGIINVIDPDACFNLTFQFKSRRWKTDIELFDALIDRRVAMMPVSGFGYDPKECWMRLTFTNREEEIKKGIKVLATLLES